MADHNRERFEKWAGGNFCLDRWQASADSSKECYASEETDQLFSAWQAATREMRERLAVAIKDVLHDATGPTGGWLISPVEFEKRVAERIRKGVE